MGVVDFLKNVGAVSMPEDVIRQAEQQDKIHKREREEERSDKRQSDQQSNAKRSK
jgi:hypothetical protein